MTIVYGLLTGEFCHWIHRHNCERISHNPYSSLESVSQRKSRYDSLGLTSFVDLDRTDECQEKQKEFFGKENIELNLCLSSSGVFLFLPIAVNLFLIQHKESQRYLCGENNQLFGLVSLELFKDSNDHMLWLQIERNERQCVFETKRSDIDFGRWDSYRLFYESPNRGYLSISHLCHTRLRRKFDNDNYLNFLAFVRINTDISSETAAARRIVHQQDRVRMKSTNQTNHQSPKLISDYRQRFRFSLPRTTTTTTTTTSSTTPMTFRRFTASSTITPMRSLIVHVYSPTNSYNLPSTTRRWRSRRTRRP